MNRSFFVGLLCLAACGGNSGSALPDAPLHDANHVDTAIDDGSHFFDTVTQDTVVTTDGGQPDSGVPDGGLLTDSAVDSVVVVDGGSMADATAPTSCDVLTQTGCTTGQKCTWAYDASGNGEQVCTANGTVALGGACTFNVSNPSYDNCTAGNYCLNGACEAICNANTAAAPMCDANHACQIYDGLFTSGTTAFAGVCDSRCDPLTQTSYPNHAACNSAMPATPDHECVSADLVNFTCAPVAATALSNTDRVALTAPVYLNSCAPGFEPLFYQTSTSTTLICTGFCSPLDIDSSHAGNAPGDATVAAKLPLQAAPMVGNATCAAGKKGSESSEECRFLWPLNLDSAGNLTASPYNNTLGYCWAPEHYMYDSNGDGTLDTVEPYCASLSMTNAIAFGCYTSGESGYPAHHPAPRTMQHGLSLPRGAATLARHTFD